MLPVSNADEEEVYGKWYYNFPGYLQESRIVMVHLEIPLGTPKVGIAGMRKVCLEK